MAAAMTYAFIEWISRMANVICIMMQRDEVELLDPWVTYHCWLFGMENLIIIDNGSCDEGVLSNLRRYAQSGCTVIYGFNKKKHFEEKGNIVSATIKEVDKHRHYDFIIPLDCDEFVVYGGADINTSRAALHSYLDILQGFDATLTLNRILLNVPQQPGIFIPQQINKTFFRQGTCVYLDKGYHNGLSCHHPKTISTEIALFHFHNRPFSRILDYTHRKLDTRVDTSDLDALLAYRGDGEHLKHHFFETEDSYNRRYDNHPAILCFEIIETFEALGISVFSLYGPEIESRLPLTSRLGRLVRIPFDNDNYLLETLDPVYYLTKHPDLTKANIWGLRHFTQFGFLEGRAINRGLPPTKLPRNSSMLR